MPPHRSSSSRSSFSSGGMIDDETRDMIIKKTWCHGQAIMPIYGVVLLWWYLRYNDGGDDDDAEDEGSSSSSFQDRPLALLIAALFLPYWCYISYRSIFTLFSYQTMIIGGLFVEISHVLVISVAIRNLNDTFHLLMFIASSLFFIETIAFLIVVTIFRTKLEESSSQQQQQLQMSLQPPDQPQQPNQYYQDVV